jgi:hypothetical protein
MRRTTIDGRPRARARAMVFPVLCLSVKPSVSGVCGGYAYRLGRGKILNGGL